MYGIPLWLDHEKGGKAGTAGVGTLQFRGLTTYLQVHDLCGNFGIEHLASSLAV